MQTEMSRVPLAEDEHSRKGNVGGGGGLRPAAPHIPFLPWSSSAFSLEFLSAFHTEIHGKSLLLSNANATENANANAICF